MSVEKIDSGVVNTSPKMLVFEDMDGMMEELFNKTRSFVSKPVIEQFPANLINPLPDPKTVNNYFDDRKKAELFPNRLEGVNLSMWKLVDNVSAKLLYVADEVVCLDCLVDREERIYEEREFAKSLFDNFILEKGELFKVCIYERPNQQMIEIKKGRGLVSDDDFPKVDFFAEFGDMELNTKRG